MSGCRLCGGFGGHHDPVAHDFADAMQREHDERQTVYEAHEWTSSDPDACARCDVEWDCADATCEPVDYGEGGGLAPARVWAGNNTGQDERAILP